MGYYVESPEGIKAAVLGWIVRLMPILARADRSALGRSGFLEFRHCTDLCRNPIDRGFDASGCALDQSLPFGRAIMTD
ncbi:hypothetical protein [Bradyrhizobium cenepequi]|uniref:hypothetical protein n=1 Tax=Bradyrhizobium cenepequi TaxID=2821403 RepID=UPI001CE240E4|nr:hypothetical protein [Bradyrhizobium cenepequi]